jgi:hypothetical protein
VQQPLGITPCQYSLPELNKEVFINRDVMVIAFIWHTVYDGYTKEQCAKHVNLVPQVYAAHLVVQKEDKSLARAFVVSVLTSPLLKWIMSLEFHMVPTYQNDNGPATCTKLQESIAKHKEIQDKIEMAPIPDLQCLDFRALQQKSMEDEMEDSATAVAEKKNQQLASSL